MMLKRSNAHGIAHNEQPNVDKTAAMYISLSPPSLPLCFPSSSVAIRIRSLLAMCFGQHYQRRPRPARRWIILLLKSLLNYRFHVYPAGLSPPLPSLPLICILLSVLLLWLAFTLVSALLAVIMMCHEIMI